MRVAEGYYYATTTAARQKLQHSGARDVKRLIGTSTSRTTLWSDRTRQIEWQVIVIKGEVFTIPRPWPRLCLDDKFNTRQTTITRATDHFFFFLLQFKLWACGSKGLKTWPKPRYSLVSVHELGLFAILDFF